jgi:hypothetical protein
MTASRINPNEMSPNNMSTSEMNSDDMSLDELTALLESKSAADFNFTLVAATAALMAQENIAPKLRAKGLSEQTIGAFLYSEQGMKVAMHNAVEFLNLVFAELEANPEAFLAGESNLEQAIP